MVFPSFGQNIDWCGHADTLGSPMPQMRYPGAADLIASYHMPFLITEPLDGYGDCTGWTAGALANYPDLLTYDQNGNPITGKSFVRVDDLNFSRQIYRDLVGIRSSLLKANPSAIDYWDGIQVVNIAADYGGYPKPGTGFPQYMMGAASIENFASSSFCTLPNCLSLADGARSYLSLGSSSLLVSELFQLSPGAKDSFDRFTNSEFLLGLTYAAHNFSQNYLGGRPFVVAPAYPVWISPSEYPAPYNSTYIKSLNLLQKTEIGDVNNWENGGPPSATSVPKDLSLCKANAPYGNPGGFLVSAGTTTFADRSVRNMMYYQAACLSTSIMEPSSLEYTPGSPGFHDMYTFGTVLNRMKNVGLRTIAPTRFSASDSSTALTVISGSETSLAWFYTNSTSGDEATATIPFSNGCVAISALDWNVAGVCGSYGVQVSVSIPPRGWNPIYLLPVGSDGSLLYSNLEAGQIASNVYFVSGPHSMSSWLILNESSRPVTVSSSMLGVLSEFSDLASLNETIVGYSASFQFLQQGGWYFDQAHRLLYVHSQVGSSETLVVSFSPFSGSGTPIVSQGPGSMNGPFSESSTSDFLLAGTIAILVIGISLVLREPLFALLGQVLTGFRRLKRRLPLGRKSSRKSRR